MINYKDTFISLGSSLKDAVSIINKSNAQVALVVDSETVLKGIITDGDIRRAILSGILLEEEVSKIMTRNPFFLTEDSSQNDVLSLMKREIIHHVPILDNNHKVIDLYILDDLIKQPSFPNPVILMAGGKGERLKPLTNNCPKPMLKVNGKPILEIILESCIKAGFSSFYISVNYLKEQIIDYFDDGGKWGVKISYLIEKEPLGTCGCLNLLPSEIQDDIIIMNGDIITDLDLDRLIRFHSKSNNSLTVSTRAHRVRIPFGVLKTEENILQSFVEKPTYEYQVNAGVYALNKDFIKYIPSKFYNMTDLVEMLLEEVKQVGVFPIHENWIDIGNPNDFANVGINSPQN